MCSTELETQARKPQYSKVVQTLKAKRSEQEIAFARAQGRILHSLRMESALTRGQVSARSGVNVWALYRIEMGDATATAYQIDALALVLAAPREKLFPRTRTRTAPVSIDLKRVYA